MDKRRISAFQFMEHWNESREVLFRGLGISNLQVKVQTVAESAPCPCKLKVAGTVRRLEG